MDKERRAASVAGLCSKGGIGLGSKSGVRKALISDQI